jgi:hypothetical protein
MEINEEALAALVTLAEARGELEAAKLLRIAAELARREAPTTDTRHTTQSAVRARLVASAGQWVWARQLMEAEDDAGQLVSRGAPDVALAALADWLAQPTTDDAAALRAGLDVLALLPDDAAPRALLPAVRAALETEQPPAQPTQNSARALAVRDAARAALRLLGRLDALDALCGGSGRGQETY